MSGRVKLEPDIDLSICNLCIGIDKFFDVYGCYPSKLVVSSEYFIHREMEYIKNAIKNISITYPGCKISISYDRNFKEYHWELKKEFVVYSEGA